MKKICLIKILTLFAFLSIAYNAFAITADEIIAKANIALYYAGSDAMAKVRMELTSKDGTKRHREFSMLRKDIKEGGEQKFYIYFHEPADVRKMVFMVWKNSGKEDDRWLYIPAIDLVKRISTRDKRTSFAGSDFTYEDVSGRHPDDDEHTLIKEEELKGRQAYVIKNTPKDERAVEFSYYTVWIDKETFIPLKAEYYDKGGNIHRVVTAVEIKPIQGFPTVVQQKAENLQTGHSTIVEFLEIKYDVGIKEDVFVERFLRRPPREWIK